eukprot:scaffold3854_cov95-Cylindrotheca_fusiformis.AAC.3
MGCRILFDTTTTMSSQPRLNIRRGNHQGIFLLLLLILLSILITIQAEEDDDPMDKLVSYYMIGVSGGLQDGFPDRINLDYVDTADGETTVNKAILLGKVFVRGYKAYLDVMESDWRQYTPEGEGQRQPLINPNVFATGCYEHANEHYVYLVDSRQVLTTLMKEPRFLSITPDTGIVELEHSSPLIQEIAKHEIKKGGYSNMGRVVFPLVTAVWFQSTSLVPSPTVKVVDGAEVTNFPESLALWAGADNADRLAYMGALEQCLEEQTAEDECDVSAHPSHKRYWKQITKAIRLAEATRHEWESKEPGRKPSEWNCKRQVRFGASKDMARINYSFSKRDFQDMLESFHTSGGKQKYSVDFDAGKVRVKDNYDEPEL